MMSKTKVYKAALVICAVLGIAAFAGITSARADRHTESDMDKETPTLLVIEKSSNTYIDRVNKITLKTTDGELLYECITDEDVDIKLDNGELLVIVPSFRCSCFDDVEGEYTYGQ